MRHKISKLKLSIITVLLLFVTATFLSYSLIYKTDSNIGSDIIDYKNRIDAEFTVDTSPVKFEGIGDVSGENSTSIADKFNEEQNYTKLIIELDNSFDDGLERPDDNAISMAESKALLREQRKKVKEYYTRTNNEILNSIDLSPLDVTYKADSYAPFIIAEFNSEISAEDIDYIYDLAEDEAISTIYVKSDEKQENELATAINAIDGQDIVNNTSSNGTGVVIGILDVGIVDADNANFNGVDLQIRNEWWYFETVSDHATMVASVALGVAPGASILSVEVSGEPSGEIGWMLDRDVNIINMSFGYTDTSEYGAYTSESAYCDHIARNNWVTFVGSAGNRGDEGDKYVTPPNGYNTVTVGACNDFGTLCAFSSYEEKFNINFPNLVAPGSNFSIPNFSGLHSGTSFSSPLTAGSVAVLMQKYPTLMNYPEHVLTILMSSTERLSGYATTSGFNDKVGTGMLNLENALVAAANRRAFSVSNDSVGEFVNTKSVYLSAGQRIRVAFASLVNNQKAVSTSNVTDYDLYLYNSSGSIVKSNTGTHNNEFIEYDVTTSGTYTIKIKQFSAKKTTLTDYCSYTYFISEV